MLVELPLDGFNFEALPEHLKLPAAVTDTSRPMFPHQLAGYNMIRSSPGAMLAYDMGTGKSRTVIEVMQNEFQTPMGELLPRLRNVLVVCPKSVQLVWPRQLHDWAVEPRHWYPLVLEGTIKKRCETLRRESVAQAAANRGLLAAINFEATHLKHMSTALREVRWDMIVLDESHRVKNPRTKVHKWCVDLAARQPWARRVCLTGTPMGGNDPTDLFGQFKFINPTILGAHVVAFRSRYCVMGGPERNWVLGMRNGDHLAERLAPHMIRVKREAVLHDLPEFTDELRLLTLPPADMRRHNQMLKQLVMEFDNQVITASNVLVKLLRLSQITSGRMKLEEEGVLQLNDTKQQALGELLDDLPADEPVVVFARFRAELDQIREAAEKKKRKYLEISGQLKQLADWEERQGGDVLGVQITAGGVGIDLTRAKVAVYFNTGTSLLDYEQSRARIHRQGQTRGVTFVTLACQGTVDVDIANALAKKKKVAESVMDSVRDRLASQ